MHFAGRRGSRSRRPVARARHRCQYPRLQPAGFDGARADRPPEPGSARGDLDGPRRAAGTAGTSSITRYTSFRDLTTIVRVGRRLQRHRLRRRRLSVSSRTASHPSAFSGRPSRQACSAPSACSHSSAALSPTPRTSRSGGAVMVISHRMWQRRFFGEPAIIGKVLSHSIGAGPQIVGVMSRGLRFLRAGSRVLGAAVSHARADRRPERRQQHHRTTEAGRVDRPGASRTGRALRTAGDQRSAAAQGFAVRVESLTRTSARTLDAMGQPAGGYRLRAWRSAGCGGSG